MDNGPNAKLEIKDWFKKIKIKTIKNFKNRAIVISERCAIYKNRRLIRAINFIQSLFTLNSKIWQEMSSVTDKMINKCQQSFSL